MIEIFTENVEAWTVLFTNVTVAAISGAASYKAAKIGIFKSPQTTKLSRRYIDTIRAEVLKELHEELTRVHKKYLDIEMENQSLRRRIALKRKYIWDLQQHILKKLPPPPPEQPCYDE